MKTFTKNKPAASSKPREKGYILYEGPSALDGAPIVVIATMETSNAKTGAMVQTWILVFTDHTNAAFTLHTTPAATRTHSRAERCALVPMVIQPRHLLKYGSRWLS